MELNKQNFSYLFVVLFFLISSINSVLAQEFIFLRDGEVRTEQILGISLLYTLKGEEMVPYKLELVFKTDESLLLEKVEMINFKEKIKYYETDTNIIKENLLTVILKDTAVLYAQSVRILEDGNQYNFLFENEDEEKELDREQLARIYFPLGLYKPN